jgi:hypothetical protein
LQSIDLPFGLAVAPGFSQRVSDGVDISPDRASEAAYRVNPRLLRVVESDIEFLNVFASKNASESHGTRQRLQVKAESEAPQGRRD